MAVSYPGGLDEFVISIKLTCHVAQLPEGPLHVRQRSSPEAFFRPTVNGSSSDKALPVRDGSSGKKKSFDDAAGMSRVYGYVGSPAKSRKNLMVKTFFFVVAVLVLNPFTTICK